jgi:Ran-binding protein 1
MSSEEEKPTETTTTAEEATKEEEATNTEPNESGADGDKDDHEESTATFEPVVKLEEVEVKSGEEDEVCITHH